MTDPDEIKAEIEATRAELAESADALAAKLDVKTQAADRLHEVGDKVATSAARAREAAPEPVQKALDKAEQAAQPVLAKAGEDKQRTAFAVGGVLVVVLFLRRRRNRKRSRSVSSN
jgi:uncharacterized protein DUF3618